MKFALVNTIASYTLDDIILTLYYALKRLGHQVNILFQNMSSNSKNIIFGAHFEPQRFLKLNKKCIIFNTEQLSADNCPWATQDYYELLRSCTVWDYSLRNIKFIKDVVGVKDAIYVMLGYVPEMTRLRQDYKKINDVLFYGCINNRRKLILDKIKNLGISISSEFGVFSAKRDLCIAQSRSIINIHSYQPSVLELPRLGYLWANHCAVISENNTDTEIPIGLEDACIYAPYENLVETVEKAIHDPSILIKIGERGFKSFSNFKQDLILEKIIGRKIHYFENSNKLTLPNILNIGSGKTFYHDRLNIDINSSMNPDLVLDISQPLDHEKEYSTIRFGKIKLAKESFSKVYAYDVLEHIRDLPQCMLNVLNLLKYDGDFEIIVPYDLSTGAWQDPTHIRAFNENSWLYYTKWAWYLGWREDRFNLVNTDIIMSDFGNELLKNGKSMEEILRTPRAVDKMKVILRKRKSTDDEKLEYDLLTHSFYNNAVGPWVIDYLSIH